MKTIRDVAKEAGVSVASVSRYMNNKGYVSEQTSKKIQEAIDKLDYQPNEIARSLFQKKTKMIGLIIPDISNPFFPMLAKGAEECMNVHGYQMILGNSANDQEKERQYFESFQNHNFSGVICSSEPENTQGLKIPYVVVDRPTLESEVFVCSNHTIGGQLVAKRVIQTKPSNVLLMKGPEEIATSLERYCQIIKELKKNHVKFHEQEVPSLGLENINEIVKAIFTDITSYDTIIATNDMHAIYIMKEAIKRNIKIPEDLQIIGYDGIDFAELINPALTTVTQPVYEMGYIAAELMIQQIEGKAIENKKVLLPVELIEGQTMR